MATSTTTTTTTTTTAEPMPEVHGNQGSADSEEFGTVNEGFGGFGFGWG